MYYGIDCNTSRFPSDAPTHDFYIGRLGKGIEINSRYWNDTGAALATQRVYGDWMLLGPQADPNYSDTYSITDAMNWGKTQANYAIGAHIQKRLTTLTIFADIERMSEGASTLWLAGNYNINWGVYRGFIDEIHAARKNAGTYASHDEWQIIMGTVNSPAYSDVYWNAHWTKTFDDIPPISMSGSEVVNGATPSIWQYCGGNEDADVAVFLPA